MTDRALLELAAKAVGIDTRTETLDFMDDRGVWRPGNNYWNPLTDDGDALRLAMKLGLNILPYPVYSEPKHSVIAQKKRLPHFDEEEPVEISEIELYNDDPYAATRRAIVRAAAEIGKEIP